MAADYWQERFHGKNVAMDMTMIYITVAFATVLLNNIFLTLVPYRVRIATGMRWSEGNVWAAISQSILLPRVRGLLRDAGLCRRL